MRLWKTFVRCLLFGVVIGFGFGSPSPAKASVAAENLGDKATPWESDGKDRWKSYLPGGKDVLLVYLTVNGKEVTFQVIKTCHSKEDKVKESSLEWVAGAKIAKRVNCNGLRDTFDGMPQYLEREVFQKYPPEVERLLPKREKRRESAPIRDMSDGVQFRKT